MPAPSELTVLVDAEQRLDRELAAARTAADALRQAARARAQQLTDGIAAENEAERARLRAEIETTTAARRRAIEDAAAVEIARYDAVHGESLTRIAEHVVARLVAIVKEES